MKLNGRGKGGKFVWTLGKMSSVWLCRCPRSSRKVGPLGFLNQGLKKHWKGTQDAVLGRQRDRRDNPNKYFSFLIHLILLNIIMCNKIYVFEAACFHYKPHPLQTISSHINSLCLHFFSPLCKSPLGLVFSMYCLYTAELFLLILSKTPSINFRAGRGEERCLTPDPSPRWFL